MRYQRQCEFSKAIVNAIDMLQNKKRGRGATWSKYLYRYSNFQIPIFTTGWCKPLIYQALTI